MDKLEAQPVGNLLRVKQNTSEQVLCVSANHLATQASDGVVALYRLPDIDKPLFTLAQSLCVQYATVSFDERYLLTIDDSAAIVWSIETGTAISKLNYGDHKAFYGNFSADGSKLLVCTRAQQDTEKDGVYVHTVEGELLASFKTHKFKKKSDAIAFFTPDGTRLIVQYREGRAYSLDISTRKTVKKFTSCKLFISSQGFLFGSECLIRLKNSHGWHDLQLWDTKTNKILAEGSLYWLKTCNALLSYDKSFTINQRKDKIVIKYNKLYRVEIKIPALYSPNSCAVLKDGRLNIAEHRNGTLKFLSIECQLLDKLSPYKATPVAPKDCREGQLSDDWKLLAVINSRSIGIFDTETGQCLKTLLRQKEEIESVAFSRDNKFLISETYKSTMLWDLSTGKVISVLEDDVDDGTQEGCGCIYRFTVSSDRKRLVIYNKNIQLYELPTGRLIFTIAHTNSKNYDLNITENGEIVLSTATA
jgi:WD40 repeat protein